MLKKGEKPLIALFDSGIGGLNILKACVRRIPHADFLYYADNYRVPYGNLSREMIKNYAQEAFDDIASLHPVSAVVACNTVTACCIEYLRKRYAFPIAGVQPAVKQAASKGGRYLVLATKATAESIAFKNLTARFGGDCVTVGCDGLASMIENNIFNLKNLDYLGCLPEGNFSSVVLGCTHYVFIAEQLQKYYKCPIFDGIEGTADHLAKISGIFDHQIQDSPNITFKGGDSEKNAAVFKYICR